MKFGKTLDLWCGATVEKILNGTIKVKRGQWVQCGPGPKSRLMGVNYETGTFDVAHGGNGIEVNQRFMAKVEAVRMAEKRQIDKRLKKLALKRKEENAEQAIARPVGKKKMFVVVKEQAEQGQPAWATKRSTAVAV